MDKYEEMIAIDSLNNLAIELITAKLGPEIGERFALELEHVELEKLDNTQLLAKEAPRNVKTD